MRVLVAGATGVIGRRLIPALSDAGHEAIALAANPPQIKLRPGTRIIVANALDRAEVGRAIESAAPDAIVNMLTSIPHRINPKRLAKEFALTNRLRTEGTANLLSAAAEVAVTRVISQGLAYAYDPDGAGLADEDTPFWSSPPRPFVPVLAALEELEQRTRQAGGVVLRLGHLYGPGTIYAAGGSFTEQVRAGKVPLVGGGSATFSFTHTSDVARAVLAALDSDYVGALNIVDDEPAAIRTWLPYFADLLGAPAPSRAPSLLARLAVGSWGVAFMTKLRGADNARARSVLDWKPQHTSWRTGFAAEIMDSATEGSGR